MKAKGIVLDGIAPPTVRETILGLMTSAVSADLAIANVRLAAIDLGDAELTSLCHTRLLIEQLDANFPADADALVADPGRLSALQRLYALTRSGRIEVRCAPLQRWTPDFSLYHFNDTSCIMLLGAHYFQPLPGAGTTLTALLPEKRLARSARTNFGILWDNAYDVLPTITEILAQAIDGQSVPARESR